MTSPPTATLWSMNQSPASSRAIMPSVPLVFVRSTSQKGSGWVVNDTSIVTNEHVVHGGQATDIFCLFPDGRKVAVSRIVAADALVDLAVLELAAPVNAPPIPVSLTSPQIGAQICAWGFPLAYDGPAPLLTVGYVAGIEALTPLGSSQLRRRLVLNAALNPGNSGGPVMCWGQTSLVAVSVSKHAPIDPFLLSAISALASNRTGVVFNATDAAGNQLRFVESQLVADVLTYFRSMTQVVIGEAIPADDIVKFLAAHNVVHTTAV